MPREYHLYIVGLDGSFTARHHLFCNNDAAAFEEGQLIAAGEPAELWLDIRRIGYLRGDGLRSRAYSYPSQSHDLMSCVGIFVYESGSKE